jgi:hypothetical protein
MKHLFKFQFFKLISLTFSSIEKSKDTQAVGLFPPPSQITAKLLSCILWISFIFCSSTGNAQTISRIFPRSIDLANFIPYYSERFAEPITLPKVDIEAALAEDKENGRSIPRFGVKIPTSFDQNDGAYFEYANVMIWKITFYSKEATSLNFGFDQVTLPEGAEIYFYNEDKTMIMGPVLPEYINDNKYYSDIVKGNTITIEAVLPAEKAKAFSINIGFITHGFTSEGVSERDFGDSAPCQIDFNCSSNATSFANQRDAVALVLTNGGSCSGTLMNNGCQDLKGYLLTAFHCLTPMDITLSQSDKDAVQSWVFRFNYDSPAADCPGTTGTEPTNYISFSGATFRAAQLATLSSGTDFALLELNSSLVGQPTIAFAGWDRTLSTTPSSGFGIHHPRGDVKKISGFTNAPTTTQWAYTPSSFTKSATPSSYFDVEWATGGTTEGGSSGSALFNSSGQVIGVLSTGNPAPCIDLPGRISAYGKFARAWTGSGTNDKRLSNWLGVSSPIIMNAIRSPFISGVSITCSSTSNVTYTLQNPIPGRAISWTISPASSFATTGGAATSGTTATATFRPLSSTFGGSAIITYTMAGTGTCSTSTIVLTRRIWFGKPSSAVNLLHNTVLCKGSNGGSILVSLNGSVPGTTSASIQGVTDVTWSYSGPLSSFYIDPSTETSVSYTAGPGTGNAGMTAWVTNVCGTNQATGVGFAVVNCLKGSGTAIESEPITIAPNPANNVLFVSLNDLLETDIATGPIQIQILNTLGSVVMTLQSSSSQQEIDISRLRPDVYFVEISHRGVIHRKKILIAH